MSRQRKPPLSLVLDSDRGIDPNILSSCIPSYMSSQICNDDIRHPQRHAGHCFNIARAVLLATWTLSFFFFPSDVDDPTAVQLKPILAKVLCSYLYIQNQ